MSPAEECLETDYYGGDILVIEMESDDETFPELQLRVASLMKRGPGYIRSSTNVSRASDIIYSGLEFVF